MEMQSALVTICEGNPLFISGSPAHGNVIRITDHCEGNYCLSMDSLHKGKAMLGFEVSFAVKQTGKKQ